MPHLSKKSPLFTILFALLVLSIVTAACATPGAPSVPTVDATKIFQSALLTATYAIQAASSTPSPVPTQGPTATATVDPNRTPPALPAIYQTDTLHKGDTPHTYIQDTCNYLKMRWDPKNSAPGTIVIPVMIHSITGGDVVKDNQITHETFTMIMRDLHDQGFQTITTRQLVDFLEKNAKIPTRSVILIVDDRHRSENFNINFRPFYEEYHWTVTNAWISMNDDPYLAENVALSKEGWVDYQAHGVIHNINITNDSTEEFIKSELFGSMERITKNFGVAPLAYIWPGGSFTKRGAEVAREAGFHLGFTVNPRGPIMFNWIPQSDAVDLGRPSYIPEGPVGDPLMTLPRYWDTDIRSHIDEVRQIGKEAASQASKSKATELEYYDIMCKAKLGPISGK
jgi:hypothetical protein